MMKSAIKRISIVFFLSIFPLIGFSWNALGHKIVANIAYQNLQPVTRNKVDQLVEWFKNEYPEMTTFQHLAYWPDAIRSQKIDSFTRWHYINLPFSDDGTPLKNTIYTDNAVWAMNSIETVIRNERANLYERARFLAFLIHIVGDLHQPLHSVTRLSAMNPDGDRGGNLFYVIYQNERINLHRLWDSGAGRFENDATQDEVSNVAKNIMTRYPKNSFGEKVTDLNPDHWAQEGLANAKKYVYNTKENEVPSQDYFDTGKTFSEQEMALAGYRLAEVLNSLLR